MNNELILKLLTMLVDNTGDNIGDKFNNEIDSLMDKSLIGHGVIIRCRDAGVHYGKLIRYFGRTVELKNCRRMWRWWSASENTLSAVARHGIKQSESKIQGMLDKIILLDACEIIPISGDAEKSILHAEIYNEQ